MTARQHLSLSAFWFANQLHWGALATILIESQSARLAQTFGGGLTKAEITGLVFGVGSIVAAVTPPVVGAFSDRCGSPLGRRRPFVIAGTLVNVLGLYLLWWAFSKASLAGYLLSFLVIQLGNNVAIGAFNGIIPDVVPSNQRGTASGYMAAMTQLGTILGLIIAGQLMHAGRERDFLCVTVIAGVLVLFGALTVLGVREIPQKAVPPLDARALVRSLWVSPRRYPDFAWVWVTRALFTAGWWMIQPVLLPYLGDVIHTPNPAGTLSFLGAVVLLGATVTGLVGGRISDRTGRKPIVFLAGIIMASAAVAFCVAGYLTSSQLTAVFLIAIFWGLGYGAYVSVDWALGTDVLPNREDAGKDMGVWHLSMVLPQAVAPPLAGIILSRFPAGPHAYSRNGYAAVFLVAAVFLLLSASFIWRVRKSR